MPAASRLGDLCTGHGCFPPRPSIAASPNVFVNGIPKLRVSDPYAVHDCADCADHGGVVQAGSQTVFVNGLAAARIGDPVDCGSAIAEGSTNVFIGG